MGRLLQFDSLRKATLQIRLVYPLDGYSWVARVKPTVRWRLHLIDLSEGTIPIHVSLEHDSFLAHNLQLRKFLILDEGDDSVISHYNENYHRASKKDFHKPLSMYHVSFPFSIMLKPE